MSKEKQIEEMAKALNEATFGVNMQTLADHLKPETINKVAEYLYNAGYRKQEWISVEERLPDFEGKYLVYTIKGSVTIAYCYSPSWDSNPQFDYWVTHWMPLPEPPKGE